MAEIQKNLYLVSVIIVNYQTPRLIDELLLSLGQDQAIEIILIDNSPVDELSATINNQYPYVQYIFNNANVGFAAAVNEGIKMSQGEWVFILNSDANTTCQEILRLVEIATHNKARVAAPKLIGEDGMGQPTVGMFDGFFRSPVNAVLGRPRMLDSNKIMKQTWVDIATGGAMLVHKSVFKDVGLLDESNFFMYFEDIDFSYRLKRKQISILFVPEVSMLHLGGQSANQDTTAKSDNYTRSLGKYLKKHRTNIVSDINNRLKLFR